MISGSRPGTQPLNLQGIWNSELHPSWGSKYTININIEMNYWVAEVCNLSECHEPFFSMAGELVAPGGKTAKTHCRADGWVTHHNTDLCARHRTGRRCPLGYVALRWGLALSASLGAQPMERLNN